MIMKIIMIIIIIDNSDDIIRLIKSTKSKYFLLPGLSWKRMDLLKKNKQKKKTKKKTVSIS